MFVTEGLLYDLLKTNLSPLNGDLVLQLPNLFWFKCSSLCLVYFFNCTPLHMTEVKVSTYRKRYVHCGAAKLF